jgi:DNA-binding transcriptional regulator PaaX
MLLTILGEYVAPGNRELRREVLVQALTALGYKPITARQAVARSVSGGWLASRRVGRGSLVKLTGPTLAMLRSGYPRI